MTATGVSCVLCTTMIGESNNDYFAENAELSERLLFVSDLARRHILIFVSRVAQHPGSSLRDIASSRRFDTAT